jgi:MFS family permease
MAAAITIDIAKPTTLGFVLPGFAQEYDLKSSLNPDATTPAALLPLVAITGTVIGSFVWGWLGDRIAGARCAGRLLVLHRNPEAAARGDHGRGTGRGQLHALMR